MEFPLDFDVLGKELPAEFFLSSVLGFYHAMSFLNINISGPTPWICIFRSMHGRQRHFGLALTVLVALEYCSRSKMKFSNAFASLTSQKGLDSGIFIFLTETAPPTKAWFAIAHIVRFIYVFTSASLFLTTLRIARKSSHMPLIISKIVFWELFSSTTHSSIWATEPVELLPDS